MAPISFAVIVGSDGRECLPDLVRSFLRQDRVPDDRLVIVLDAFEKTDVQLQRARQLVREARREFPDGRESVAVLQYDSGYHWLGVEQINWAIREMLPQMPCSHVFTLGDDDVYRKRAFAILRPLCAQEPTRPILFQFMAPWRVVLWDQPRMLISHISGCCIAAPKAFVPEMPTRQYVEHDYDWMVEILQRSGVEPLWLPKVLVIARPDASTGYGAARP